MTKSQKSVNFYIPSNYDQSLFPADERDWASYFLNLIHWKWICWRADAEGFVRLKWDYLQRVIPRERVKPISRGLADAGVIEIKRGVVVGKQAWGYRLTPAFRRTRKVTCCNPNVVQRIASLHRTEGIEPGPIERWLEGKLAMLEWDTPRAAAIIATLNPDVDSNIQKEDYHAIIHAQAQKFADRELWLVRDRYGRVHTPLTSLPKELRCCLTAGRARLANIDLRNSQPLMAGILARRYFEGGRDARSQMTHWKERRRVPCPPKSSRPDVEEYVALCERGGFYESFGPDRGKTKRQIFQLFFGKNHWRSPLCDTFESRFPSVAQMLRTAKERDHRRAAWLMQDRVTSVSVRKRRNRDPGRLRER